jgi:hypothetical protein
MDRDVADVLGLGIFGIAFFLLFFDLGGLQDLPQGVGLD